jgi:hypothetical protein
MDHGVTRGWVDHQYNIVMRAFVLDDSIREDRTARFQIRKRQILTLFSKGCMSAIAAL